MTDDKTKRYCVTLQRTQEIEVEVIIDSTGDEDEDEYLASEQAEEIAETSTEKELIDGYGANDGASWEVDEIKKIEEGE